MLMAPVAARQPARERLPLAAAWSFAALILAATAWPLLTTGIFPDPDDALRLVQVRDWIAGQSWFDVTQYRMNPPQGGAMHWSRLVDVPIAAVILLLRPLLGQGSAETVALFAVPLMTLGLVMALIHAITRRLLDSEAAALAALLVPVSVCTVQQLRPFRIDHHGWQIALGTAALLAVMSPNRRRAGLLSGLAAALWLQISLEGLPLAAALGALFALRFIANPRDAEGLTRFTLSLFATSLLLLVLTKVPQEWGATYCDAMSSPYLAALGVGTAGSIVVCRLNLLSWQMRSVALGLVGAAAAGVLAMVEPVCLAGPFQALDPLVESYWYQNVREGLPIWRQSAALVPLMIAFPLVGLVGTVAAARVAGPTTRSAWHALLFLLAASLLITLMVQRGAGIANVFALPGGVFLFQRALVRTRTIASQPLRLLALIGAVLIVIPGLVLNAMITRASAEPVRSATTAKRECVDQRELAALRRLPVGIIAAPLDIGPAILVATPHKVVATGHHRNSAAMRDVIEIFTLPPDQAHARLRARKANYVAVCPNLIEPDIYADLAPRGFWSQVAQGRVPTWLEPIRLPGTQQIKLWRVR